MSRIAKTLKEDLEKIPLKPCKQCGYLTRREFCTPDCRMIYNDNRIESVEDERDKYKKALEDARVCLGDSNATCIDLDNAMDIIDEAMSEVDNKGKS